MFQAYLKTYIDEIDKAIGGGIIRGAIFTVIYDTYSLGWVLGFRILNSLIINYDAYGVIHNYLLPPPKILSRASFANVDIQKSCIVIDIFGSKYQIPINSDNVLQIEDPTPETINPKVEWLYEHRIFPMIKNKKIIRLVYTIEGMSTLFGEDVTVKLLNSELAYLAKKYHERDIITIILLNKDAVSKYLTAWVSSISDNVILFKSTIKNHKVTETMLILKSPNPDFEPISYEYAVKSNELTLHKPTPQMRSKKEGINYIQSGV